MYINGFLKKIGVNLPSIKEKIASTVAENLVTVATIGIVASMVLPPVFMDFILDTLKLKWKKQYSTVTQSYFSLKYDTGGTMSRYFGEDVDSAAWLFPYEFQNYLTVHQYCFSGNKLCGSEPEITLTNVYKTLSGAYINQASLSFVQYVLKDGSNVYFKSYHPQYALIWFDVNGYSNGPNILGRDLFGVTITRDRVMPMGAVGTGVENTCNATPFKCPPAYGFQPTDCAGAGCAAEFLYK